MGSPNIPITNCLHFQIPAELNALSDARHRVADYVREMSFGPDDIYAITLAFGEACSNALIYGQNALPDAVVRITCRTVNTDCLQLEIENLGNNFYPELRSVTQMPDPEETHGRGFALMAALVDHIAVFSDGVSTTVQLTKSRS